MTVTSEPGGQESAERFRYLALATGDAIYDWDLRADTVWRNDAYLRLWPDSQESGPGNTGWERQVHPDDLPRLRAAFAARCAARDPRWSEQYRMRRADGGHATVVDRGHIVYDDAGAAIRVVGALTDISERIEIDAALRESEEKYRSLYSRSPVMLHSIDPEGRLLSVSDRWLETLGYQRSEVLGRRSTEFLTPESRVYARDVVLPAFRAVGACTDIPYQIVKKDGEIVDVLLSAIMERDTAGNPVRSFAVLIDVTERLRTEAALRESEEKLRQAQKMEAVGLLAGGIAHDFNNLLVVILGHAQLLMRGLPAGDQVRDDAEQIHAAGQRAASLTRQLLAFSRKQVLQPRVVDVNALIRDTEKLLQRVIRENIEMTVALGRELGPVRADPSQLVQVLLNLVANARDALPDGGRLSITTREVELGAHTTPPAPPGRYLALEIADNGCGMDAITRARLFEPFFTTKQPGQGTGLGLSTVHGIVQQSGGHLTVDTELGLGTSIRIFLPRVDADADAAAGDGPVELPPGAETILLVEDDVVVRRLVCKVLEHQGYAVLSAGHPREALELATRHIGPIDVLLTDVVMPSMSGTELAQRITQVHRESRVVYMSGYARPVLPDGGAELGEDFLPKPFTMESLLIKVREVVQRPRASGRASG